MRLIKLFILVVVAVIAVGKWPEILAQLPPNVSAGPAAMVGMVLYGLLVALMFRPWRKPKMEEDAVLAAVTRLMAVNETRMDSKLQAFSETLTAALGQRMESESGKFLADLQLLRAFDPSIGQKIPQVLELAEALKMVKWPQLNLDHNVLSTLERVAELHGKLDGLNLTSLDDRLDTVFNLADSLENIHDNRDFDSVRSAIKFLNEVVDPLTGWSGKIGEMSVEDLQLLGLKIDELDKVMTNLENLGIDNRRVERDFEELGMVGESAAEALSKVMTSMQGVMPEGRDVDTALETITNLGKLVEGLEDIVLDGDGDVRDFSELEAGVDALEDVATKLKGVSFLNPRRAG